MNIKSDKQNLNYKLYRKNEKIISSNIINPNGIDNISIIYNTNPKMTFEKEIITINPKQGEEFILPNGMILNNINVESFYNDIETQLHADIPENFLKYEVIKIHYLTQIMDYSFLMVRSQKHLIPHLQYAYSVMLW